MTGETPLDAASGAEFDAELSALFDAAAPTGPDPAFTEQVLARTAATGRVRLLALGAAGLAGGVLAASQLPRLLDLTAGAPTGWIGELGRYAGPETLATLVFAAIALGFARVLGGDRLA